MSESVSYNTSAIVGGAENSVRAALRRRGLKMENTRAWAMARERAEQLQTMVNQELDQQCAMNAHKSSDLEMELTRMEAMLKGFASVNAFQEYARLLHGNEMDRIIQGLDNLKREASMKLAASLKETIIRLQNDLENIAASTQKGLCDVEKIVLQDQAAKALNNLGYQVERNNEAMKATMGQTCIWMETNRWGEMSMDYSGFSGMTCLNESKRVEEQFRKQGLIIQQTSKDFHGKPEGGALAGKLESIFPIFRHFAWEDIPQSKSQKLTIKGGN